VPTDTLEIIDEWLEKRSIKNRVGEIEKRVEKLLDRMGAPEVEV
jgi:hypothetical protein